MVLWYHPEICTGDTGEGGQGIPIVDYSAVGTTPGLSQEAVGVIHIVDHSLVESGKKQVEAVQCRLVFHLYHLGGSLCQHSLSIDLFPSAAKVAAVVVVGTCFSYDLSFRNSSTPEVVSVVEGMVVLPYG